MRNETFLPAASRFPSADLCAAVLRHSNTRATAISPRRRCVLTNWPRRSICATTSSKENCGSALRDAIVLALENNSLVRVQETQIDSAKFTLLGAHQPFDPVITDFLQREQLKFRRPSASCKALELRLPSSPLPRLPSSPTRKLLKPGPTFRPESAATITTPITRSTFTTRTSLRFSIFKSRSRCSRMAGGSRIKPRW